MPREEIVGAFAAQHATLGTHEPSPQTPYGLPQLTACSDRHTCSTSGYLTIMGVMAGTTDLDLPTIVASGVAGDEFAFERIVATYDDEM